MPRRKNDYTTVKLPTALLNEIDKYIDNNRTYTSRTDLIKEALRRYFKPD